ncbi:YkvA family protein [Roseibium sp. M-1]
MKEYLRTWAARLKRDIDALYLAGRDPRVPWHVKALAMAVAAYALSPIDLIPDFIPVIGYLDDLLLVPLGIFLVVKLIPTEIMEDCRRRAALDEGKPVSRTAAVVIFILWGIGLFTVAFWLAPIVTVQPSEPFSGS